MSEPVEPTADQARLRAGLGAVGFTDDGHLLRGPIRWTDANGATRQATVEVTIEDDYPLVPPQVRLVDAGADLEPTFHIDDGNRLCLWEPSTSFQGAPWTRAVDLVGSAAGWLESTAKGWPGDEDLDLERYLPSTVGMVLYDMDAARSLSGCVRTQSVHDVVTVLAESVSVPLSQSQNVGRRRRDRLRKRPSGHVPAKFRNLAYIADIGELSSPLTNWDDIALHLASHAREVNRLIRAHHVDLLLLWYRRGGREGALAVRVEPGNSGQPPSLKAVESADTSQTSRRLRSGPDADRLAHARVAVIGCGAVGSHLAEMLFRDGVRRLTLVDYQTLRPGNLVRHVATDGLVRFLKSHATRAVLQLIGLDSSAIKAEVDRIAELKEAQAWLAGHDLVVDATGDDRTTTLLIYAAETSCRSLISVCVQRQGGIARVDRYPLEVGEQHLPELPALPGEQSQVRERGCGDAVSLARPSAAIAAAQLAVDTVRHLLIGQAAVPATTIRVIDPQPDKPYTHVAIVTSPRGASR